MGSSSPNRDEISKYLSCHHLVMPTSKGGNKHVMAVDNSNMAMASLHEASLGQPQQNPGFSTKILINVRNMMIFWRDVGSPGLLAPILICLKNKSAHRKKCEYNNYMNYIYIYIVYTTKTSINTTGLRSIHGFLQEKTRFCFTSK